MSTLSIPMAVSAPRLPVGRVRLTRRGRLVFLLAFLGLIAALMVTLGGVAAATFESGTPEPVRVIEVGPGDTLYDIAGDLSGPGEVQQMVAHLEQLNGLDGPQLQVGQRLAIPTGSGS